MIKALVGVAVALSFSTAFGLGNGSEPRKMSARLAVTGSASYSISSYETCGLARDSALRQAKKKCLELGYNDDFAYGTFGPCTGLYPYVVDFEFNCVSR